MLRILCQETDAGEAANVEGGKLHIAYKTFDIDVPELEKWLNEKTPYTNRTIVGSTQP